MDQFVTAAGSDRYHRSEECPYFQSGRRGSEVQDAQLHDVERVTVGQAAARGKTPCLCVVHVG